MFVTVKDKSANVVDNKNLNLRNYCIAEYAAKEGLIPLFTLFKKDTTKALHEYAIEKIGRDRVDALKAKIKDIADIDEKRSTIKKYLIDIEPNIEILLQCNDEENINNAWSNLSAKWSRDIINYLEGILNEEIPTIELPAEEINRAVSIFESINKGGTPLDTYDLIVAKAAKDKNLESLSKRLLEYLQESLEISDIISGTLNEALQYWYPKNVGLINDNELT